MSEEFVKSARSGDVISLRLNRPDKLNSFTFEMAAELQAGLEAAAEDDSVRAVVIAAEGKAFCAGQDLGEATGEVEIREIVRRNYNPSVRLIRTMPKPTIAAVQGVAAGAGANLAFACDFVIASENASFIQAFSKIGLVPDTGGSFFLPRLVGMAKATELMMLGGKLSAQEAAELGAIYRAVPAAEFESSVESLATELSQMPTKALFLTRLLLEESTENNLDTHLEREAELQSEAGESFDHKEGVQAFLEKRKPVFKGH